MEGYKAFHMLCVIGAVAAVPKTSNMYVGMVAMLNASSCYLYKEEEEPEEEDSKRKENEKEKEQRKRQRRRRRRRRSRSSIASRNH